MQKFFGALLCIVLIVSLSSCSLIQPVTELMKPPKLSQKQLDVDAALKNALGTRSINLKYPRSGSYRSAFVFYDIDNDGTEEALVFYLPGVEESGVRINLLDYEAGAWVSVFDVPGQGSGDVDFISFENIESSDYKNIVIGWQPQQNVRDKIVTVYRYENKKLQPVFDEKYTDLVLDDFNGDSLMDIMLLSLRRYTVMFVTHTNDEVRSVDEVAFSQDIQSISQLLCGGLPDYKQALFMDVALNGADYATEIFTVENNLLVPLINISAVYTGDGSEVTQEQTENFQMTQRVPPVLSADINGDGMIEVPSSSLMLGYEEQPEETRQYLTTYGVLTSGVMKPVLDAAVNLGAGYMIKIPEIWRDKITVVAESDLSWQFIKYNGSLNDRSVELLRVSRILKNDYQDRFATDSTELAQKSLYRYFGYIPPTSETEMRITNAQLRNMFMLL